MNNDTIVFINYTRKDLVRVKLIYNKLLDLGLKPWMDIHDVLPGKNWPVEITKSIKSAHFILICLSRNSVGKRGYVQKEIKIALDIWQEKLEDDIFLIPVLLEDCKIPDRLSKFQGVKLYKKDGWEKLVAALKAGIEHLNNR